MAEPQPLNLQPVEAIEYFAAKNMRPRFDWRDTAADIHARSFTVAKAMEMEVLQDIRNAVGKALSEGQAFGQFRKELEPLLVRRGWWGRAELPDPLTGQLREVQLGSVRRLQIIYDTNIRSAYAWGHWQRIQRGKVRRPYLLYDAVNDSRTRPEHAAWDGIVLPVDDPWWKTHFPPNGWRCRCSVRQLSDSDLESEGLTVTENPPSATRRWQNQRTGQVADIPVGIDPGFAHNVGEVAGGLVADIVENVTGPKVNRLPLAAGAKLWWEVMSRDRVPEALSVRFSEWADPKTKPGPGVPDSIVVGALHPDHVAAVTSLIGAGQADELSAAIMIERRRLNHMRREVKIKRDVAVPVEDIKRIPDILRYPRAVVLQHADDPGAQAVHYVFNQKYPKKGDDKLGTIVVRPGLTRTARDFPHPRRRVRANWIVTASLVDPRNLRGPGLQLIAGSLD